jgi:(1->4)-alpha-D-glucan 1-alpha-D-glucosylmutase
MMRNALSSELNVLSTELLRIARADRSTRDYTLNTLRRALSEVAACMPVYRSYIVEAPSEQDRVHRSRPSMRPATAPRRRWLDLRLRALTLLADTVPGADKALCARALRLAIRFQQFSAPVTAKGVEDTAFYRYFPLSSLNEVGGEPAHSA